MLDIKDMRDRLTSGADIRQLVWENLKSTKISIGQLDPNGLCNAGCWFCPVKHEGNPQGGIGQMEPDDLEAVLASIRGSTVAENFNFMYTAHYNEVLLYKHFDKMLNAFRSQGFSTMVLSNGTTMTPAKTDLVMENSDVAVHVALNIPSLDKERWIKQAGFNESVYNVMLRNLKYLHEHTTVPVKVLVNCMTEIFAGDVLPNGIMTPRTTALETVKQFNDQFPKFTVDLIDGLVDRAGWLTDAGVLKNQRALMLPSQQVIGCDHDLLRGSRLYSWLHVNANGDVFICCDDYKMEYKFGNLKKQSLDNVWLSHKHVDMIIAAFNSLCRRCAHHIVR